MKIHHGAAVLVTDGRKGVLLTNHGDADFPDLRLTRKWEQASPADLELKSDAPGRAFSSHDHGTRRSSYDEPDLHMLAEAQFAAEIAEFLNRQEPVGELVIVAPPRTLAQLRKHLDGPTADRVTAEIAKDLMKHPIGKIEQLIAGYAEPV